MKIESVIAQEFPKKVVPLIQEARNSINIIVFDWRWYPDNIGSSAQIFNQAIIQAARRGVKVRVLTNCQSIINLLNQNKISAKKFHSKKLLHCKFMMIDDRHLITGSHNYTQSAFSANMELSVILKNLAEPDRFIKFFNNLFGV